MADGSKCKNGRCQPAHKQDMANAEQGRREISDDLDDE
jgi:hypothetical protein